MVRHCPCVCHISFLNVVAQPHRRCIMISIHAFSPCFPGLMHNLCTTGTDFLLLSMLFSCPCPVVCCSAPVPHLQQYMEQIQADPQTHHLHRLPLAVHAVHPFLPWYVPPHVSPICSNTWSRFRQTHTCAPSMAASPRLPSASAPPRRRPQQQQQQQRGPQCSKSLSPSHLAG